MYYIIDLSFEFLLNLQVDIPISCCVDTKYYEDCQDMQNKSSYYHQVLYILLYSVCYTMLLLECIDTCGHNSHDIIT